MTVRARITLVCLLLSVPLAGAAGQSRYFGAYCSFKGGGVTYSTPSEDGRSMTTWTGFVDISGLLLRSERLRTPGTEVRFSYDYFLREWTIPQTGTTVRLIGGPGIMAGLIRDAGKKHGPTVAITGEIGLLFDFVKEYSISVKFTADLGIHYGKRSQYENINRYDPVAEIYRNGLYRIPCPEIRIMRRF